MINEEFYEQVNRPTVLDHFDWGWLRRTRWTRIFTRGGSFADFTSWWFFGHLQIYHGSAKCNGSLSHPPAQYTMTDLPRELRACRWRSHGPDPIAWDNMGGC